MQNDHSGKKKQFPLFLILIAIVLLVLMPISPRLVIVAVIVFFVNLATHKKAKASQSDEQSDPFEGNSTARSREDPAEAGMTLKETALHRIQQNQDRSEPVRAAKPAQRAPESIEEAFLRAAHFFDEPGPKDTPPSSPPADLGLDPRFSSYFEGDDYYEPGAGGRERCPWELPPEKMPWD